MKLKATRLTLEFLEIEFAGGWCFTHLNKALCSAQKNLGATKINFVKLI